MQVVEFAEKPEFTDNWINGGYFFFKRDILRYLSTDESCVLEREPLMILLGTENSASGSISASGTRWIPNATASISTSSGIRAGPLENRMTHFITFRESGASETSRILCKRRLSKIQTAPGLSQ